jgi:hypothetical protein
MATEGKGEFNEPTCSEEEESDSGDIWDHMTIAERCAASKEVDAKKKQRRAETKAARKTRRSDRLVTDIVASQERLYNEMEAATKRAAKEGKWDSISVSLPTEADVLAFTAIWAKPWTLPGYELVIKHTAAKRTVRYYQPGKPPRKEDPKTYSGDVITYRELSRFRRIFK